MSNNKVDYNKIAGAFSKSRKGMKWEEIDYFLEKYFKNTSGQFSLHKLDNIAILDVGCGSGRLLEHISKIYDLSKINYAGLDLSADMLKEAKNSFPNKDFFELDMLHLDNLKAPGEFDYIFFIASFHHLETLGDRLDTLTKAKSLLKPGGAIFMTNWALDSKLNHEKYKDSIREGLENRYGSKDYTIYFGEYPRFYHCFTLEELEELFNKAGFQAIENREFDNQKNFISIIKRPITL